MKRSICYEEHDVVELAGSIDVMRLETHNTVHIDAFRIECRERPGICPRLVDSLT